jgi:hypothetical protein
MIGYSHNNNFAGNTEPANNNQDHNIFSSDYDKRAVNNDNSQDTQGYSRSSAVKGQGQPQGQVQTNIIAPAKEIMRIKNRRTRIGLVLHIPYRIKIRNLSLNLPVLISIRVNKVAIKIQMTEKSCHMKRKQIQVQHCVMNFSPQLLQQKFRFQQLQRVGQLT